VGKRQFAHEEHEGHEEEGRAGNDLLDFRFSWSVLCAVASTLGGLFLRADLSGSILLASILARRKIFASREENGGLCHKEPALSTSKGHEEEGQWRSITRWIPMRGNAKVVVLSSNRLSGPVSVRLLEKINSFLCVFLRVLLGAVFNWIVGIAQFPH
jgi:hypothetical protein